MSKFPGAMKSSGRVGRRSPAGFTLIEILVVVAIIALLISILLPSLARAKEQARQSVCLSNLKQQGNGCASYSASNRGYLPWAGNFRYTLAEGEYYVLPKGKGDWLLVNNGALYPRYVGKEPRLFYCPSNKDADGDGPRGMPQFVNRYQHPKEGTTGYVDSHDAANGPIGAYVYALPAVSGNWPRDDGARIYSKAMTSQSSNGSISSSPYYQYMNDPQELSASEASSFLGDFPQKSRGKHTSHALMSDAYFGGYVGYHLNGFNVLYGDMHARRIIDPKGVIVKGTGGGSTYTVGQLYARGKPFMVWDYFSRQQ